VILDEVSPPLGFRGIHWADLTEWHGEVNDANLAKLFAGIRRHTGPSNASSAEEVTKPKRARAPAPKREIEQSPEPRAKPPAPRPKRPAAAPEKPDVDPFRRRGPINIILALIFAPIGGFIIYFTASGLLSDVFGDGPAATVPAVSGTLGWIGFNLWQEFGQNSGVK